MLRIILDHFLAHLQIDINYIDLIPDELNSVHK